MNTYKYAASDEKGQIQHGEMQAESREEVAEALSDAELQPVSIKQKVSAFNLDKLQDVNIGGIPLSEKVVFMRQLATMLSAGVSINDSLEILKQQIDNPAFKSAINDVAKKVVEGMPLSKALEKQEGVFDDITISLIKAGEESGRLEEIFLKLADELEKKQDFQAKVRSAMIYPIIMVILIIGVVVLMMVFIVPEMKKMFADFGKGPEDLPMQTKVVVAISEFMLANAIILVILLVGLIVGGKYFYDSPTGKKFVDKNLLKIPIWGNFITKVQVADFTRTMTLLVKSGLDIVDVLDLTSNVLSNYWFKKSVLKANEQVKKGVPLALPISRSEYFPPLVSRMIAVGEETGKLEVVLSKLSGYYNREVKQMTENLSTMIEPIMLIVMGGIVAFIAFAVYGPMFQMSTIIGG
jgi:type IV pilus assembly protein PilC